jgi:hypothetical protein
LEVKPSRFSLPEVVTIVEEGSVIEAEEDHMEIGEDSKTDQVIMEIDLPVETLGIGLGDVLTVVKKDI